MADKIQAMQARIKKAVRAADDAFWAEIVKEFPEVESGDFGPAEHHKWGSAMQEAVVVWLLNNHPQRDTTISEVAEKGNFFV